MLHSWLGKTSVLDQQPASRGTHYLPQARNGNLEPIVPTLYDRLMPRTRERVEDFSEANPLCQKICLPRKKLIIPDIVGRAFCIPVAQAPKGNLTVDTYLGLVRPRVPALQLHLYLCTYSHMRRGTYVRHKRLPE